MSWYKKDFPLRNADIDFSSCILRWLGERLPVVGERKCMKQSRVFYSQLEIVRKSGKMEIILDPGAAEQLKGVIADYHFEKCKKPNTDGFEWFGYDGLEPGSLDGGKLGRQVRAMKLLKESDELPKLPFTYLADRPLLDQMEERAIWDDETYKELLKIYKLLEKNGGIL